MTLLVRKINRAKWDQRNILEGEDPSADAITHCLRTSQNTLSVWAIEGPEELPKAVTAIASSGDHVDTLDVAMMSETELTDLGVKIEKTFGRTPYDSMGDAHRDIEDIDYTTLGSVSKAVVSCFREKLVRRFTRSMIIELLGAAVKSGAIAEDALCSSIREKIGQPN